MLSLVLAGSMLAVSPPALPPEPAPAPVLVVEGPAPEPAPATPEVDAVIVVPAEGALPVAEEVGSVVVTPPAGSVIIIDAQAQQRGLEPIGPRMQAVPKPPWSGAGRFVGGSFMLVAGVGLLTAATMEFSEGRDTTRPLISQVPAAIAMLAAGGIMIGTGVRDQRRLGEWEAATKIDAKPMGTGLIVGGVAAISLGSMAAIATSIAADMDLNAPRSIPAGWATAGVTLGGGGLLLIAGVVRRARYGKWRNRVSGMPMVAPTRAGATLGLVGQF